MSGSRFISLDSVDVYFCEQCNEPNTKGLYEVTSFNPFGGKDDIGFASPLFICNDCGEEIFDNWSLIRDSRK